MQLPMAAGLSRTSQRPATRYNASCDSMNKRHYLFKLIPPRPTFPQDMTDEEKAVMDEHSYYFQQQFAAGKLLLYGPVMAPDGAFGLGILEVADEAEARQFSESDPSVRAGLNRWEFYPMQVAASRAKG
jgi:uncharacterized protein